MIPSGAQYELAADGYRAVVTEVGATLRRLSYDGRDLVRGFDVEAVMPVWSGAVLAPWPNRIADGHYEWDGREYQVPVNEVDRHTALHGLVSWSSWSLLENADDHVALAHRLVPTTGYPWCLELTAGYVLSARGVTVTVTATNRSDTAAPYGVSIHPYLRGGDGPVDDWTLQLPARRIVDVDDERLLPTGTDRPAPADMDFRTPRRLGDVRIDHAYTDLSGSQATVTGPDGTGVLVAWGDECRWVQVHTADRPEPELNRTGLAIEPMTCPPGAFNSGIGVQRLEPGASSTVSWRIAALTAGPGGNPSG